MGGIDENELSGDLRELVSHWEREMTATTHIDGPIDKTAKEFLHSLLFNYCKEVLDNQAQICSASKPAKSRGDRRKPLA